MISSQQIFAKLNNYDKMPSHLWSHLNQRYVLTTDNHRGWWYSSTINHTRRVSLINSLATLAKPLCRGVSRDHLTRVFQLKANVYFFMTQLIYFTTTFIHIEWPQLSSSIWEGFSFFFLCINHLHQLNYNDSCVFLRTLSRLNGADWPSRLEQN